MNVKTLSTIIGFLIVIVGAVISVNAYFAKDCDFNEFKKETKIVIAELDKNFRQHRIEQSLSSTQERIWKTEDRLEQKPNDPLLKERLRELKEEKKNLEYQLEQSKR